MTMGNLPGIAIVTPTYNSEKTIAATIESVVSNEYPSLDYLLVDGKSADRTLAIAERYVPHIRILSEPDKGQSDAINKGFANTKGDILGWLNADDILYPNALREVGEFFSRHPDAVGVYGDGLLIDESGKVTSKSGVQPFDRWRLIHSRNFIEQQSCFFRREAFEAVGGVDLSLKYVMDWDLWIKLSQFGDLVYIPKVLSARRLTRENKTESGGTARYVEICRMLHRYGATWTSPATLNYLYETFVTQARWGRDFLSLFYKALYPFVFLTFNPWFIRRMTVSCYGSYPDGYLPPRAALVIPPSHGHSTLLLQVRSVPVQGADSYQVALKINQGPAKTLVLKPGDAAPVEYRAGGLDAARFNLVEFISNKSVNQHLDLLGRSVSVSASVQYRWINGESVR